MVYIAYRPIKINTEKFTAPFQKTREILIFVAPFGNTLHLIVVDPFAYMRDEILYDRE
jgi:hypothetical protein